MKYFRITNWEKLQHYKKRNPPWIKLYRNVLADYSFSRLQDASKLHLFLISLLASTHQNRLPWDEEWVKQEIKVRDSVNLTELKESGYIEEIQEVTKIASKRMQKDSEMLAKSKQSASPRDNTIKKDIVKSSLSSHKLRDNTRIPPPYPPESGRMGGTEVTEWDGKPVSDFEKFWERYPKKVSIGQAERTWKKLKPNTELQTLIFEGLERAKRSWAWTKDNGQYIPNASTWLRAKGWLDKPTEVSHATTSTSHSRQISKAVDQERNNRDAILAGIQKFAETSTRSGGETFSVVDVIPEHGSDCGQSVGTMSLAEGFDPGSTFSGNKGGDFGAQGDVPWDEYNRSD